MPMQIGILTAGGDTPGLNAAIRAVGNTGHNAYGMEMIGFYDGFRGLMENRTVRLTEGNHLSGILTVGGTILGTSRDKPYKMLIGGKNLDMTDVMVDNYYKHHLDALVCLGGGGTNKNAHYLMKHGLKVITLPKTIDNDIWGTDISFGFDTAMTIATDAIDRLHSTAHSHHRIIVVEIMGHNTGWLALAAGTAGGADVILIPEIPYHIDKVAEAIMQRTRRGTRFSIVAVSEGAMSAEMAQRIATTQAEYEAATTANDKAAKKAAKLKLLELEQERAQSTHELTLQLEQRTGLESRVTILGHVQRGGVPSPADRLLATRLGAACAHYIHEEKFGVMVCVKGRDIGSIPLDEVVGKRKNVPLDHSWVKTARGLGVSLGDE